MRIAILGATSQIAKDLVLSFLVQSGHELVLYARRPQAVTQWLASVGLTERYVVADFATFNVDEHFDAILNFVGVGDPAQAAAMGASIFDVTLKFDEMALNYLRHHPGCRYLFLSSGAAYGLSFAEPVEANTKAVVDINNLQPLDWYGVAKLHAECRHRSQPHFAIVDIRVFNYFSHTQDMDARFLITDIVRAIRDKHVLITSAENIVRDYIDPQDFCQLVSAILASPPVNTVVDCYSQQAVDKITLLAEMQAKFGLEYRFTEPGANAGVNATGAKANYYSRNTRAAGLGYQPTLTALQSVLAEVVKVTPLIPTPKEVV